MVIEEQGVKILLDPGAYSTGQKEVMGVNVILITHEHPDHLDPNSLKIILENNPMAKIFTNAGVGKVLSKEGIAYELLTHGKSIEIRGVRIEGREEKHTEIYPTLPTVYNTGYLIANRFFYPGDALTQPNKQVEILALPVAAPWMKLAQAIDYAKELKPKICFPVHDGMLKIIGPVHRLPESILTPEGIQFTVLEEGEGYEF